MSYLNDKRNYHEVNTINLNSTALVYKKNNKYYTWTRNNFLQKIIKCTAHCSGYLVLRKSIWNMVIYNIFWVNLFYFYFYGIEVIAQWYFPLRYPMYIYINIVRTRSLSQPLSTYLKIKIKIVIYLFIYFFFPFW